VKQRGVGASDAVDCGDEAVYRRGNITWLLMMRSFSFVDAADACEVVWPQTAAAAAAQSRTARASCVAGFKRRTIIRFHLKAAAVFAKE
jgi:hypothetical protein